MRRLLIAICVSALPMSAFARDHAFEATLYADVTTPAGLHLQLNLTNHTDRDLCFFLDQDDVVLHWKGGTQSQFFAIPDHGGPTPRPQKAEIVWNDAELYAFRLDDIRGPFKGPDDEHGLIRVTYRLKAYDCLTLFSRPYGSAKPLYTRDVSQTPYFIDK